MTRVPRVSIRRDPRFTLEENWKVVEASIHDCQTRGVLVTPLTVFDFGTIVGWYLSGWQAEPGKVLYQSTGPFEQIYTPDYCI